MSHINLIPDQKILYTWYYSFGYQITGNGKWVSLMLKRPKKKGGAASKKEVGLPARSAYGGHDYGDESDDNGRDTDNEQDAENDVRSNAFSEPQTISHFRLSPTGEKLQSSLRLLLRFLGAKWMSPPSRKMIRMIRTSLGLCPVIMLCWQCFEIRYICTSSLQEQIGLEHSLIMLYFIVGYSHNLSQIRRYI